MSAEAPKRAETTAPIPLKYLAKQRSNLGYMKPEMQEERKILQAEQSFFSKRYNEDDNPNYIGVLTITDPRTATVLYPQLVRGMLTIYDQIEAPVDPDIARRFIFKYLTERLNRGELVSDEQVAQLTNEVKIGKYLRQLAAYGTSLDELSGTRRGRKEREERSAEEKLLAGLFSESSSKAFREYRTINTQDDVIFNKRLVLARFFALQTGLQTTYGEVDYQNALLTELLLDAPFVDTVVAGENIDEEARRRHQAYLKEILDYSTRFNPAERYVAFMAFSGDHQTDWVEEVKPPRIEEFDKSYLSKLYQFARVMRDGEFNIEDLYSLFNQTVLRRGKLFKATATSVGVEIAPVESESVTFDDIGGYEEQKRFFRTLLERTASRDPIVEDIRIILSAGKPGVGKSLGVLAFLSNLPDNAKGVVFDYKRALTDEGFIPELDALVRMAKLHHELHLFAVMEDIDALAGDRLTSRSTREFLEIDSALPDALPNNLHIIATTNRADIIDPAVIRPGRTSKILVYDIPQQSEERKEVARIHTRRNNLALSDEALELIAKKTHGFTPDEVRHVVWSLRFDEIANPTDADIEKYVAEIKRKHKIEKGIPGFRPPRRS